MPERPPDHSDEHVELPELDEPGAPETAPHPLVVDEDEAQRGLEEYREVDDQADTADGPDEDPSDNTEADR